MRDALQRAWLRRGALACALWPLSLFFGALAALRRTAYRSGLFSSERVPVLVIVVGNVVVGGSGKTPVVMAVLDHLRSRGIAAGVVSRGYGRTSSECREVNSDSDPRQVGDEPLLVVRSCAVPVFVATGRAQAARALLKAYPATRVIVCDDGLQHYALQRDIEICVFDDRGAGNGWLLPAGPLRESWPRPVDLVLRTAQAGAIDGFIVERQLAMSARRFDGARCELTELRGKPVVGVAAIARPQAFFDMLRQSGLQLTQTLALPDHADFKGVADALPMPSNLVCTEKDAAKLWRYRPDAWAVPLLLAIDTRFWAAFDRLLDAKLSSAHGPQTS
jgi:tetraacyldisaccharide 4'-kinase